MQSFIKELINNKKYSEALKETEYLLNSHQFDLTKSADEELYSALIQLRITAKTLSGLKDEFIADLVKREKHLSKIEYTFEGGNKIILQLTNQFRTHCDAYVNLIDPKTYFEGSTGAGPRSEFIKRLGLMEINKQIKSKNGLNEGDYCILRHPNLSAPYSYHILFNHDQFENEKNLAIGIKRVLDDAHRRKLELLSFFPLGFGTAIRSAKDKQEHLRYEIASSSAEPIVEYFFTSSKKQMPIISYNFVDTDTMFTYDKVFFGLSKLKKNYFFQMKNIDKREKNLIKAALTFDEKYIETLKELTYSLDDDSNILLTGETGSGKSYLAKVIHDNSLRSGKPFEKINCGMLKPNWIYVELFGAKQGSYTDCKEDREGAIGRAEKGTLFLDEIGNTDLDTQKMLLKFLDDGTYRWLGDKEERQADVRIILGTDADLDEKIARGEFLKQLYERIAQRQFEIPPIRVRKEDIIYFSEYIIDKMNANKNCDIKLSDESKELLRSYKWPGNIRQLKSYLEYLHTKAYQLKQSVISTEIIENKPPRDYTYRNPTSFEMLEISLASFIKNWNEGDGKISRDIVEPILAKVYIDDTKLIKTNSGKIIGIDGTSGDDGPLMERYRAYPAVKEKFSK